MNLAMRTQELTLRILNQSRVFESWCSTLDAKTVAVTALFIAAKFEGDGGFSCLLFKQVLDQNSIPLAALYSYERRLFAMIDLSVMIKASIYDEFVTALTIAGFNTAEHQNFTRFIQKQILNSITDKLSRKSVLLASFAAAVFFFTGSRDEASVSCVAQALMTWYAPGSNLVKRFSMALERVGRDMVLKGNRPEFVESVIKKIDCKALLI